MLAVSVIIPTYNRAHLISRAIQSVLDQTFADFEIIVVDDGSTDSTEAQVKKTPDARIRYIRRRENGGECAARNTGIEAAGTRYLSFLDSDDEWAPNKLAKQMKVLQSDPEIAGVYTGFWRIVRGNREYVPKADARQKEGQIFKSLLWGNFITPSTVTVTRDCLTKAGPFNESLPVFGDWELWLRIAKHYRFAFIDEPLVNQYIQPDSLSVTSLAAPAALDFIFTRYFDEMYNDNKKLLAKRYRQWGKVFLRRQTTAGRKFLLQSLKIRPTDMRCLLRLVRSFLPGNAGPR